MAKKIDIESNEPPEKKINDVAKPGQTPPPPTSRPIITGHSGVIKHDPMVSPTEDDADENDENKEEKKGKITKKSELKLEAPPGLTRGSSSDDTENPAPADDKPESSEPEQKETGKKDDQESSDEESSSDKAAIDTLADSASGKKQTAKEAEETEKNRKKIEELIESKKYSVPIVEGGHKASSQRVASWAFLLLLLVAVGVYLAIDAGYLDIGISLPYDFIAN